jgi:putative transposase
MFIPRLARIAAVNIPYHVTQRGNARQFVLTADSECLVYLQLLRQYVELYELSLLGYCLMSNHVHLIVVPRNPEALRVALKQTHGRYASYWNAAHRSSGHVWQGRFYSCPLDEDHLWMAMRYAEFNPVRAGLVSKAEQWRWSSAAAHCGGGKDPTLEMAKGEKRWPANSWREYLERGESDAEIAAIRKCTHTGRPLGAAGFVRELEQATLRCLVPQKGGRPSHDRAAAEIGQKTLAFERYPDLISMLETRKRPVCPPVSGGKQVLKPQCLQCSRQQGGQVAAAVRKTKKEQQPQ